MTFEWLNETDDDDVKSSGFPSLGMDLRMMMTLTHPPVGSFLLFFFPIFTKWVFAKLNELESESDISP